MLGNRKLCHAVFKPAIASLFHEITWNSSNARNCVSPHILPSTALSKVPRCKVPSWLLLPKKNHANCPFPKTTVGSPPPTTLTGYPPQTTPAVSAVTPALAIRVIIPTVAVPFQKNLSLFSAIRSLSLCSGGSRGRRLGQLPRVPREGAPKRREQKYRESAWRKTWLILSF